MLVLLGPRLGKYLAIFLNLGRIGPIPSANNTMTNPKLPVKIEPQDPDQQNPSATAPKTEQCGWGPNCPICKNAKEDWDSKHQKQFQQTDKNTQTNTQQIYSFQTQDMRQAQAQNPQCIQHYQVPQNPQPTQTQCFDVPDCYAEQI